MVKLLRTSSAAVAARIVPLLSSTIRICVASQHPINTASTGMIRFSPTKNASVLARTAGGRTTPEFALWPLFQAARSCFGSDTWPSSVQIPQAWLEFDVKDVEKTTAELETRGYRMLIRNKKEPWGQTVSRFISPEGLLGGITFTPWMRQAKH